MLETIKINQKLEQILLHLMDVLRLNIVIVDAEGKSVWVSQAKGYGWNWVSQHGIVQYLGRPEWLNHFEKESYYLKSIDAFGLQSFAIPIIKENEITLGYLMVGPVILNRRLESAVYQAIAQKSGVDGDEFLESLNEIRVLTFNSLKSILDLLSELSQYALKINSVIRPEDKTIFITLLDLAMTLSGAECGSIMLFDQKTKELSIQVQRGLNPEKSYHVRLKLGEGIAGLAAQRNESFIINEEHSSNRIRHLLKKPELKCAVILPIMKNNNEVLGVMNLSTHQRTSRLATHSQQMLKSLKEITAETLGHLA